MKKKIQLGILSVAITQLTPLLGKPALMLDYRNLVIVAANLSLWLFQPAVSGKETKQNKSNDQYSVLIILIMSVVSTIVPIVDWAYFSSGSAPNPIITIVGFIILWSGVLLRNYSIKKLGKYFTPTVQLQNDHNLITSRPYNVVRHPSYLGALLAIVGIAVFLNSLAGTIIAFACMMIAYRVRIDVEEKALKSLFGKTYTDYQKGTKRLIPYVW